MSSGGYGDGDRKAARTLEVQKMIKDAFALFDKDSKGVCDVREVGTVVRHLGINPTEVARTAPNPSPRPSPSTQRHSHRHPRPHPRPHPLPLILTLILTRSSCVT